MMSCSGAHHDRTSPLRFSWEKDIGCYTLVALVLETGGERLKLQGGSNVKKVPHCFLQRLDKIGLCGKLLNLKNRVDFFRWVEWVIEEPC